MIVDGEQETDAFELVGEPGAVDAVQEGAGDDERIDPLVGEVLRRAESL